MRLTSGYDHKTTAEYTGLDFNEVKSLRYGQEVYFIDKRNEARRCRVTGAVKTWKTRPFDLSVPVKYGLYESFRIEWRNGVPNENLYRLA